jgi:peroxiredoxin
MKYLLVISFSLLVIGSYGQASPDKKQFNYDSLLRIENKERVAWIGKAYPDFSVTINNKEYSNPKLKGKVIFANFWFAACRPCLAEMEDLNKLYEKFGSNPNFEFLSFTYENAEQIEIIRKKYNIKYKIVSISREECYRLNLKGGFPTNIVIDKNGLIKYINQFIEEDNFVGTIYPSISTSLK